MTFLLIATGNYKQYVQQCTDSIRKFIPDALIYLFSDSHENTDFKINHIEWPYVTLYRFHYFLKVKDQLIGEKIFYMDIDAKFVREPQEIIKSDPSYLIGVRHSGHYFEDSKSLPNETNKESVFYHYPFKKYFGGGFFGGNRDKFFELCQWCKTGIDSDLSKGIIPRHNDETALNSYFTINPPNLELSPSYHFPGDSEYIKNHVWKGRTFEPVLWLLEKNHELVRK